jgi:hypothetical protein
MNLIGLTLALAGAPVIAEPPEPTEAEAQPLQGRVVGQVTVRQRIIIRVPAMPIARTSLAPTPALPPIVWVEREAPQCVPVSALSAASIQRPDSVDLVLNGGKRLRARLGDECPALDFYTGVYLKRTSDGMLCAERDAFRSRAGGECRIEEFTRLVPRR